MMQDLWPDGISANVEGASPVAALRMQASLLGQKTQGLVKGAVRISFRDESAPGTFCYNFCIVCPPLDFYHYVLFKVRYPVEFYPLTVNADPELLTSLPDEIDRCGACAIADGPAMLVTILRSILGSAKTKRIIEALILQVSDAPAGTGQTAQKKGELKK